MSDLPRRTIEDLAVRYELEPGLKDVFVEGQFDQDVLGQFFEKSSLNGFAIYQIDTVEVPYTILKAVGLSEGKKQRVIALAHKLAYLPSECSFRCLVDRDLDHWFGVLPEVRRLIWTKHTSLELYYFSDELLRDYLLATSKAKITDWPLFADSFISVLTDLYAIRLANRYLSWNMTWLSPSRCMTVEAGRIKFASNDFSRRLLLKNGKGASAPAFESAFSDWRAKLVGDHRGFIHGHDFVELLAWAIAKYDGLKEFASVPLLERLFVLTASQAVELASLFA